MAYQARRAVKKVEVLELVNEDGLVEHKIEVDLSADGLLSNVRGKYVELQKLMQKLNQAKSDNYKDYTLEELGSAVTDLYKACFGDENTLIILEFYKNRVIEMTKEVTPFILDVVIPRASEIKKEISKQKLSKYKRGFF